MNHRLLKFFLFSIFVLHAGLLSANEVMTVDTLDSVKFRSINLDPFFSVQQTNAKGVKMNLISSVVEEKMHGVQLSGISNIASEIRGVQLAVFTNTSQSSLKGMQMSLVSNISVGVKNGTQISPIANISSGSMHGFQFGGHNYTDTLQGVQIGIFNANVTNPRGMQIGIFNYSRDTVNSRSYGLVTIKPNTELRIMGYGGTSSYVNTALQIVNGNNYSIFGIGALNRGFNSHFSGSLFYRFGRRYSLCDGRLSIGGDLGFSHIEAFENDNDETPNRLYSLQPRLTLDYGISSVWNLYGAFGYEFTRHYGGSSYHNGPLAELGLSYRLHFKKNSMFRTLMPSNHSSVYVMPADNSYGRSYPWLAAAEVFGINALVHCYDRFVLKEDYAVTTMHSIRNNFRNAFVWDNDNFKTNQFMHPYHGNLYFTSARSNGMNFWQSYPYALGGSLMWEFFGENTPPSINDVFSTSFGGAAIGEVTFRLSSLVLDDSSRGPERFFRELIGFVAAPMRGLNRLIHGDAFIVRNGNNARYHDYERLPVTFDASTGARYIADNGSLFRGSLGQYVNVRMNYGDPMSSENKPYDFFNAEVTMNMWNNQPRISNVHLLGLLYGKTVAEKRNMEIRTGIFQHFNYYSSESVIENEPQSPLYVVRGGRGTAPFRISETAAVGPGAIMRFQKMGNLSFLEQRIFLNAILMGGSQSDYYRILWRDYNIASGYSAKVHTFLHFGNFGRLTLKSEFFHLFTWKGYSDKAKEIMNSYTEEGELEYINAQGDPGNAKLFVISPHFQFNLASHLMLDLFSSYYLRQTNYREHATIRRNTFELRMGVTYKL